MADSSTATTRSKKKKLTHKSKKKSDNVSKELSPTGETDNEPKADSPTRSTSSPDPNCAICLGKLENKSFTDSCFHMFCFVCLLEWSKVKNECPLCKQSFKSIIHNVRSYDDYDQYHLSMYRNHSPEHPYSRSFRYRTTLTEDRVFNLRNRVIGNPTTDPEAVLQLQAIGAPPNTLRASDFNPRQDWNRRRQVATSDFRRRIYTNGMRLASVRGTNNRVRDISPAFFTANPALTHRLVPWLNRELNGLLYNQESHVQFVLELIMGLIKRFEIASEEFFQHLSPFFSRHTRHFMHEFESFAKSPYCMIVYDKKAIYEQQAESVSSGTESINSISDDDSDVQIISTDAAPSRPSTEFLNLPDISAEMQVRTSNTFYHFGGPSFLSTSSWNSPTPGPSWYLEQVPAIPVRDFIPALGRSVGLSDTEIDTSSDSESTAGSDVVFVAYDKPWDERSPINLSTDSDRETVNKKDKKKEGKSKKHKSKRPKKSKQTATESTPAVGASVEVADMVNVENPTAIVETVPTVIAGPSEAATTSQETSHRHHSRHKSKSWRDNHYNNRLKILFHRRSTSPEMSDSGRRKDEWTASSTLPVASSSRERKRRLRHMRRHIVPNNDEGTSYQNISSSTSKSRSPESKKRHKKKSRKESRSPSVEIVSIHPKDKLSKKKHKKHKHKSSHKHHKKTVASSVTVPDPNPELPAENECLIDSDGLTTTEPTSLHSSVITSEACESTRSFTDAFSSICDTLTPVQIASSIAKKTSLPEDFLTTDDVLDLTVGNVDELDCDILDVVTNDTGNSPKSSNHASSHDSTDPDGSKSFKKHPSGHKRSRTTNSASLHTNPSLTTSLPDVMMHGDPLFSHSSRPSLFSNVLESFHSAFVSNYNPHAWYKHPPVYTNAHTINNRPLNLGIQPSSTSSLPLTVSEVRDPLPLDLRQVQQQADSTRPSNMDLTLSSSCKSSPVTSSQSGGDSDSQLISPLLDVVSCDQDDVPRQSSQKEKANSSSGSAVINVIDLSPTEVHSSDSEQTIITSSNNLLYAQSPCVTVDGEEGGSQTNSNFTVDVNEQSAELICVDEKANSNSDTEFYGSDTTGSISDLDVENCDVSPQPDNNRQSSQSVLLSLEQSSNLHLDLESDIDVDIDTNNSVHNSETHVSVNKHSVTKLNGVKKDLEIDPLTVQLPTIINSTSTIEHGQISSPLCSKTSTSSFSNLPLPIYIGEVTDAPSQSTGSVKPPTENRLFDAVKSDSDNASDSILTSIRSPKSPARTKTVNNTTATIVCQPSTMEVTSSSYLPAVELQPGDFMATTNSEPISDSCASQSPHTSEQTNNVKPQSNHESDTIAFRPQQSDFQSNEIPLLDLSSSRESRRHSRISKNVKFGNSCDFQANDKYTIGSTANADKIESLANSSNLFSRRPVLPSNGLTNPMFLSTNNPLLTSTTVEVPRFPIVWNKRVTPLTNTTWREEEGSTEESNEVESSGSDSDIEVE